MVSTLCWNFDCVLEMLLVVSWKTAEIAKISCIVKGTVPFEKSMAEVSIMTAILTRNLKTIFS